MEVSELGCGICGFVGLSDKSLLKSMCDVMRHRGPDQTDYYLDGRVGLGIDRLKIIDLVSGDQPIHNEDGTIWVVFNGEIYNYQDLRLKLEAMGHRFYTSSDTECIVHAYEAWGEECVKHFRGMFAFAVWDSTQSKLYLARDRFGKKPLYYTNSNGVFVFGSELKAILQYHGVKRELDSDAVDYFFTYRYVPSPSTIFKGIQKLPPGSYAVLLNGNLTVMQYWDFLLLPDVPLTEDALVDLLYRTMEDAVRVRMRSEVPLGAFLSGGIDSSVVVSLMSRLTDVPVKTVSIGFDNEISETAYSRRVAEYLKTDHHEYIVAPESYKVLPKLIWHFDEPFADSSIIPTYYLSEVTRKEVTVALSGDGGDELFMGYPFIKDPASYYVYSKLPSSVRKAALRGIMSLPFDKHFKRTAMHAYEKNYSGQPLGERYAMRMSIYGASELTNLYSSTFKAYHTPINTYDYITNLVRHSPSTDPVDAVDYAAVRSFLEEDILVKVDRLSMAASLEVRCPLLDQELAAFVAKIPSRLKMNGRETKYIFKKMALCKNLIPREIVRRKKQGFGSPIESWMKKEWKELLGQVLDPVVTKNYTGLFDIEHVKSLVREPYLNSDKLFSLVTFVLWHKMYMEGDKITTAENIVTLV